MSVYCIGLMLAILDFAILQPLLALSQPIDGRIGAPTQHIKYVTSTLSIYCELSGEERLCKSEKEQRGV